MRITISKYQNTTLLFTCKISLVSSLHILNRPSALCWKQWLCTQVCRGISPSQCVLYTYCQCQQGIQLFQPNIYISSKWIINLWRNLPFQWWCNLHLFCLFYHILCVFLYCNSKWWYLLRWGFPLSRFSIKSFNW